MRYSECLAIPACDCKRNRDLRNIKWAVARQTCCPVQLVNTFAMQASLNIVVAQQKMRSCEVRIQLNRISILFDCSGIVTGQSKLFNTPHFWEFRSQKASVTGHTSPNAVTSGGTGDRGFQS